MLVQAVLALVNALCVAPLLRLLAFARFYAGKLDTSGNIIKRLSAVNTK